MPPSIARESPDQAEIRDLLAQADRRSAGLYPGENRPGPDVAALIDRKVRFFVARLDGRAIGCGGHAPDGEASAELKRIFVTAATRGTGVGRLLLQAIEADAIWHGIRLMRLETGIKSVEAIGLHRRFGYHQTGPFGAYAPDPLSVFMAKMLVPGA